MTDSVTFVINIAEAPPVLTSKIIALRVQNLTTGDWFNWDVNTQGIGSWDANGIPHGNPGDRFYVGAYIMNTGDTSGNFVITLRNRNDGGDVIWKTQSAFIQSANFGSIEYTTPTGLTRATTLEIRSEP